MIQKVYQVLIEYFDSNESIFNAIFCLSTIFIPL